MQRRARAAKYKFSGDTVAIPWEDIEREYITTTIGQRALADKYGISTVSLNNHSSAGNWVQKREAYSQNKLVEEPEVDILPGPGYFILELSEDTKALKPRLRYHAYSAMVKKIPKIDTADPIQVRNRVNSYFDCCTKNDIAPSPADLARWLKISVVQLRRWLYGEFRKSTHQPIIEDAWTKLEADLVNRVQTGAISPPSGIFLLKNWMGYKDVQDIVVAPKNPLGELQDKKALEQRIMGTVVVEDFSVSEEGAKNG